MAKEILCKNCKHGIVKRYNHSKLMQEWKHKTGGTYCKARWTGNKAHLLGCLCSNAEPLDFANATL